MKIFEADQSLHKPWGLHTLSLGISDWLQRDHTEGMATRARHDINLILGNPGLSTPEGKVIDPNSDEYKNLLAFLEKFRIRVSNCGLVVALPHNFFASSGAGHPKLTAFELRCQGSNNHSDSNVTRAMVRLSPNASNEKYKPEVTEVDVTTFSGTVHKLPARLHLPRGRERVEFAAILAAVLSPRTGNFVR